jgi:hypothetical protein
MIATKLLMVYTIFSRRSYESETIFVQYDAENSTINVLKDYPVEEQANGHLCCSRAGQT